MSVDGIGKPPTPDVSGPAGAPSASAAVPSQPFRVEQPPAAAPARVSEALASFSRGEITLDQYLDQRVEDASAHLEGVISPAQVDFVKQSLREQLETDPVLVELVRRTTASASSSIG
jgi:hypothetical protein